MSWRKKSNRGKPSAHRTWLSVWMEFKGLSINEFGRILLAGHATVERWKGGRRVSRHYAQLVRAFFPDCPIHLHGGPPTPIHEQIPGNARTPEFYRYIFKIADLIEDLAYADAIGLAREKHLRSEASQGPLLRGEPDSKRIADVLPPAPGGEAL